MAKPVWTTSQIINQLNSGSSWVGSSFTYGFPADAAWFPGGEASGASSFSASQKAAATNAISLWDDLIAPSFSLASNGSAATVRYMNTTQTSYAHAYFPGGYAQAGSVWMNPAYNASTGTNDLVTPTIGQWGSMTYIHETGHSLGLDHPGPYNGGSPTYAADALYSQDSLMYTVMSYFDASNTGADWVASDGREYYAQTPMLHDIMTIQSMYGADPTTRAGSTTYGYGSTAGRSVYDFSVNKHPVLCIYDAGGTDTLNLSGSSYACTIDLRPGTFSSTDQMTSNISIALGTLIENAIGGSAADRLTGNGVANSLNGGGGNDTLIGGGGNDGINGGTGTDTAVFNDPYASYSVSAGAAADTFIFKDVHGSDGTDTVSNTELFSFAGVVMSLASLLASIGGSQMATGQIIDGSTGDDTLIGGAAGDTLRGGAGNDKLNGVGGADHMIGGVGNDTYYVNVSGDVVDESNGGGIDTVVASINYTLGAAIERLTLTGSAAIGNGNASANLIVGTAGANKLSGLGGNDMLRGEAGADTLTGGAGNDTFVFSSKPTAGAGLDTITDFARGQDHLQINASAFGGGLAAGHAFALVNSGSHSDALHGGSAGYFIYEHGASSGGTLYWDANGGFGGDAVAIAKLGVAALAASDFLIV